jgi:dipeptidyl aminopeptidase/acylaminoacyl peptidase
VARGYAIVQPDLRGSVGYGAAYAHLDDGPHRTDVLDDVSAVLDWIAHQPDLDARHVVVMGTSYGGFVALLALARFPDRLRGAIEVAGIADLASFLAGTSVYRRDERRAEYGDERDPVVRARLDQISPLSHAAEIRRPLLVAHAEHDPRVPSTATDRLVAAVRGAGQEVWYLHADDEGHGFASARNRGVFQVIATQFLDRLRVAD